MLFGSLATRTEPHERTDVDLAVYGLDFEAMLDAALELEALFGAHVDLVLGEEATPSLRRRIEQDGVEL